MNSRINYEVSLPARQYTIFAPAFAKWWGSDARALAQALRQLGHSVVEVDEEDFVSWHWHGLVPKVLRRLFQDTFVTDYNEAVLQRALAASFDFVLVFKGKLLQPETVRCLREQGKPVYNIYPDVSFRDHGPHLPQALQYYDCVFTTKSYHGEREQQEFKIRRLEYVRHGFDPEVHRPVALSASALQHYGCDVSFVGCWSPEKEATLLHLLRQPEGFDIKVYGIGWKYASAEFKQRMGTNLRAGVFGDELALVYRASKINLGLLSYAKSDASLRDQTTARTFQIPATKSFLLHEDTPEVRSLFRDGEEAVFFANQDDLVAKIKHALREPDWRAAIGEKGHARCVREPYDYSSAARAIIRHFEHPENKCEVRAVGT